MQAREYTVQEGDTLGLIAERELGDMGQWERLYAWNRETIAVEQIRRGCAASMRGPNWIFPGMTIRLHPGAPSRLAVTQAHSSIHEPLVSAPLAICLAIAGTLLVWGLGLL